MTDMTPERLRAAADHMAEMGYSHAAHTLREEADLLEEKGKREKRVEYLVQVYTSAIREYTGMPVSAPNDALRAGIRAVAQAIDYQNEVPF